MRRRWPRRPDAASDVDEYGARDQASQLRPIAQPSGAPPASSPTPTATTSKTTPDRIAWQLPVPERFNRLPAHDLGVKLQHAPGHNLLSEFFLHTLQRGLAIRGAQRGII